MAIDLLTLRAVWKTWFFTNYEKLYSKIVPNPKGVSGSGTGVRPFESTEAESVGRIQ